MDRDGEYNSHEFAIFFVRTMESSDNLQQLIHPNRMVYARGRTALL